MPRYFDERKEAVLADAERHTGLCEQARPEAVRRFAYPVVVEGYLALYSIEQEVKYCR